MIIADTGFFLALANADDLHHNAALKAFGDLNEPLITTWPVMTETSHLMLNRAGQQDLLSQILFIAYFFQPVDYVAVESLGDGDVRHSCGAGGTVPMLFARREPHNITGMDRFNRPAFTLHASATRRHYQRLPQRMGVPRGPGAGFKCNYCAAHTCRIAALKWRVNPHCSGKPFC